jgi:hypothetical protein
MQTVKIYTRMPTKKECQGTYTLALFYCGLAYGEPDGVLVRHSMAWRPGSWYLDKHGRYFAHCGCNEHGTRYHPFAWMIFPRDIDGIGAPLQWCGDGDE